MTLDDLIRTLAEASPMAVVITDADLAAPGPRILYVNEAFTRMTGYAAEEMLGASPRMLQGPATRPLTVRAMSRALRREGRFHGHVVNHRKNGEEYICEVEAFAVRDEAGRILFFAALEQEVRRRRGRPSAGGQGRYEPVG
jgi:PAS domain S-box-containing protein